MTKAECAFVSQKTRHFWESSGWDVWLSRKAADCMF